jgi:hypothetical protein
MLKVFFFFNDAAANKLECLYLKPFQAGSLPFSHKSDEDLKEEQTSAYFILNSS